MKNLAIALFSAVLVAACSSGNTISDVPQNVTSTFQGSFTDGVGTGSITLNLSDDNAGNVSGNLIVTGNTCLQNASFTGGVSNGFTLTLPGIPQAGAEMFTVVTTTTVPPDLDSTGAAIPNTGGMTVVTTVESSGTPGTQTQTLADGTIIETEVTPLAGAAGTLDFQLSITNGGSTLSGTFVSSGGVCPAGQGSGSITLNG